MVACRPGVFYQRNARLKFYRFTRLPRLNPLSVSLSKMRAYRISHRSSQHIHCSPSKIRRLARWRHFSTTTTTTTLLLPTTRIHLVIPARFNSTNRSELLRFCILDPSMTKEQKGSHRTLRCNVWEPTFHEFATCSDFAVSDVESAQKYNVQ